MKRLTTLTGKNLPRLAVAKPGWPGNARQGELLEKPKRRMRGQLMHVCDAGDGGEGRSVIVRMRCEQCNYQSGWLHFDTVTEAKRGLPCPECNVCDQTGLSGTLRKDRGMAVCTYDNPATMARECWANGELFCSYSVGMLLSRNPIPAKNFFFGANIGPWKEGQLVGDKKALDAALTPAKVDETG